MARRGRRRKIRVHKKIRTRVFGSAARGAKTPAQIRAAVGRERVRRRSSWRRSRYRRKG